MTTFLIVSAALASAGISRHIVLMIVAYLALRRSPPEKRAEILRVLGPVLTAVRPPDRRG